MDRIFLVRDGDGDILGAFSLRGKASAFILKTIRDQTDVPRGTIEFKMLYNDYKILEIPVQD